MATASASEPAIGLSMKTGLPALKHRQDLLQVRPAVVGLQQHAVDPLQQLVDRIDDLDAELLHLLGVFRHALGARLDVGAALGIGGDDAAAGDVRRRVLGR